MLAIAIGMLVRQCVIERIHRLQVIFLRFTGCDIGK